jgi:nucleoside-diphosphate-sugar epimerase
MTRGQSQSLLTAAKIVQEHFPKIGIKHEPRDLLNPERGSLSIEKASDKLFYKPTHDLILGLDKYITWYRDVWKVNENANFPSEGNE